MLLELGFHRCLISSYFIFFVTFCNETASFFGSCVMYGFAIMLIEISLLICVIFTCMEIFL